MSERVKRFPVILLALVICGAIPAACAPAPSAQPTPVKTDLRSEEQAVYTALFEGVYGEPQMYVLMSETTTDISGVENTDSTLKHILSQMTGVDDGTVAGFRARNDAAYPVPADMDIGIPYVLLTREEMNQIFDINTSGWDVFYTRYPNSPGITTISRIGFNADLTQALVYVGTQSHWLAGAGYYVLLVKKGSTWTIDQKIMTWIS
jgi:hypothetical protein